MKNVFWVVCALGFAVLAYDLVWLKRDQTDESLLAAGMAPQIALIEDIVSDHGWSIDCRGRSGDMTVVRLTPGWWPSKSSPDEVREDVRSVATTVTPSMNRKEARDNCDLPEDHFSMRIGGESEVFVVAVGPRDVLELYLEQMEACEVRGAQLGPATSEQQIALAGESSPDWIGLFIDPKLEKRSGPLSCMGIMTLRKQAELLSQE